MEDEDILDIIDEIRDKGLLIVVEGVKDKKALENLGITNIITLKKPLYAVVEEIAANAKEIVLLTDLDQEGKKLYHQLAKDFQKHKVKINNKLREALFKTQLRHIEGIATYFRPKYL